MVIEAFQIAAILRMCRRDWNPWLLYHVVGDGLCVDVLIILTRIPRSYGTRYLGEHRKELGRCSGLLVGRNMGEGFGTASILAC